MEIRPEAQFLIDCCRVQQSDDWPGLGQRASAVRCWDPMVTLSAQHGIATLVLPLVKELSEGGSVPDRVVSEVRQFAFFDVARGVRLRSALREMLPVLRDAGAEVIVLKGVALASLVYSDPNARPSQDIDLLCKEEDYPKFRDALASLRYDTDADLTLPPRQAHHESYADRHFFHPDGFVHIELHVDSIKLGVRPRHSDSIWRRARPIEIEGAPALALGPEDQVLMLSVHLHRHGFNRLIWFKDIDLLIRRYEAELD
ncbi:MAG: nucleotidyltransferase family protein, partial [Chloroflexi bacterium]|nr:nucleotidyltransferase family protein [Chloroflexota bacterium]